MKSSSFPFFTALVLCFAGHTTHGKAGHENLMAEFEAKLKEVHAVFIADTEKLGAQYAAALGKMRAEISKSGDLDMVLEVVADQERVKGGDYEKVEFSKKVPSKVVKMRQRLDELLENRETEFHKEVLRITTLQKERLEKLVTQLTQADKVDEALAAQQVLAGLDDSVAKRYGLPAPVKEVAPPTGDADALKKAVQGKWTWIPQEKELKGETLHIILSADGVFAPSWKKTRGKWKIENGKVVIEADDWRPPVNLTFDREIKSFEARFGIRRTVAAIGTKVE